MIAATPAVIAERRRIDVQTSALDSAQGQSQLLRQLMELARANASQEDSSQGAGSTQSATGDQQDSQGTPPAPPAAGSTPADMFSGQTLGALTTAQERAGDWRHQMDSIVADQMVSQLDTNGDGSLSLSEIESALGVSGGSDGSGSPSPTGASSNAIDGLTAAFAQVDSNGDGQLSADELTSALGQMQGHRGHHHHHHPDGDQDDALASSSGAASNPPGGSTTGAAGSTGTTPTDPTTSDPAAASGVAAPADASAGSGAAASASTSTSTNTVATLDGLTNADFAEALQAFLASLAQSQAANLNALGQSASPTSVTA
jgi:hypothetical protein